MDHGRKCCVPGCTGKANTHLPKEPNIRKAWLLLVHEQIPAKFDTFALNISPISNSRQFQAGFAKKLNLKTPVTVISNANVSCIQHRQNAKYFSKHINILYLANYSSQTSCSRHQKGSFQKNSQKTKAVQPFADACLDYLFEITGERLCQRSSMLRYKQTSAIPVQSNSSSSAFHL